MIESATTYKSIYMLKYDNLLFGIYFLIISYVRNMEFNSSNPFYQLFVFIGLIALIIKIAFTKFNYDELFKMFIVSAITAIIFFMSGKIALPLTIITLIGMKNISIDYVVRLVLTSQLIVLITNIITPFVGLAEFTTVTHNRNILGYESTIVRNAFGFNHPNTFHSVFLAVLGSLIYLSYKKYNLKLFLFYSFMNYFIYTFSGSRTGLLSGFFIVSFFYFIKNIKLTRIKSILQFVPLILSGITIAISHRYSYYSSTYRMVDNIFQGRINYSNYFLRNYPITLFGQRIVFDTWHIIDSGYIELLLSYGLIAFLSFNILTFILIGKLVKRGDKRKIVLIISYLIISVMEYFILNVYRNFSLIFYSLLLFKIDFDDKYS